MTTTRTRQADRYQIATTYGTYATGHRTGVLAEHLHLVEQVGGTVRPSSSGSGVEWVVWPDGEANPVVCGELVRDRDNDNFPISVRCGLNATRDGMCEGHAAQVDSWRAQSPEEVIAWEHEQDERDYPGCYMG